MQSAKPDTRHESDPKQSESHSGRGTQDANVLVWLPSPMGDAILCTPALRAIRKHFKSSTIWFLANSIVREALSPGDFNDKWIEQQSKNPLAFKHYNPAEMIEGQTMRDLLRIAVCYWHTFRATGTDPCGAATLPRPSK